MRYISYAIKMFVVRLASRFGYSIIKTSDNEVWTHEKAPQYLHSKISPLSSYSPWLSDKAFLETYKEIKNNTLVDIYRCYELWSLAKQQQNVEGSFLEVGVWRGGTGTLISAANRNKETYLADTFEGVVKAGENDPKYKGGEHWDTSPQVVEKLLTKLKITNAKLLIGTFPDDTGYQVNDKISFLHCDVDVYESARSIISWAEPKLTSGAIVVFDDFGFYGCEGITKLVEELKSDRNFLFVHNLNGHAIFLKRF